MGYSLIGRTLDGKLHNLTNMNRFHHDVRKEKKNLKFKSNLVIRKLIDLRLYFHKLKLFKIITISSQPGPTQF
jgi:hypothetical protein